MSTPCPLDSGGCCCWGGGVSPSLSRTSREESLVGMSGLGSWGPGITRVAPSDLRAWWDWEERRSLKGVGPIRHPGRVVLFSGAGRRSCWAVACCLSCRRMVVKRV